jgi:hypothetical protein
MPVKEKREPVSKKKKKKKDSSFLKISITKLDHLVLKTIQNEAQKREHFLFFQ